MSEIFGIEEERWTHILLGAETSPKWTPSLLINHEEKIVAVTKRVRDGDKPRWITTSKPFSPNCEILAVPTSWEEIPELLTSTYKGWITFVGDNFDFFARSYGSLVKRYSLLPTGGISALSTYPGVREWILKWMPLGLSPEGWGIPIPHFFKVVAMEYYRSGHWSDMITSIVPGAGTLEGEERQWYAYGWASAQPRLKNEGVAETIRYVEMYKKWTPTRRAAFDLGVEAALK